MSENSFYSRHALLYKRLCAQSRTDVNNNVCAALKGDDLNLNVETLKAADIDIVIQLLLEGSFRRVRVYGRFQLQRAPLKRSGKAAFSQSKDFKRIFEAICSNVANSHSTVQLAVAHLQLSADGIKAIADTLRRNSSVRVLRLTSCDLDYFKLSILKRCLQEARSIAIIDFSSNALCDRCVEIVEQIAQTQTETKNDCAWQQQLRVSNKSERRARVYRARDFGLKEIRLSNNRITETGAKVAAHMLANECLLEALDLSANQIKEEGVKALLQAVHVNSSILRLELNQNIGYAQRHEEELATLLSQNMQQVATECLRLRGARANLTDESAEQAQVTQRQNSRQGSIKRQQPHITLLQRQRSEATVDGSISKQLFATPGQQPSAIILPANALDEQYEQYVRELNAKTRLDEQYGKYVQEVQPPQVQQPEFVELRQRIGLLEFQRLKLLQESESVRQLVATEAPELLSKLDAVSVYSAMLAINLYPQPTASKSTLSQRSSFQLLRSVEASTELQHNRQSSSRRRLLPPLHSNTIYARGDATQLQGNSQHTVLQKKLAIKRPVTAQVKSQRSASVQTATQVSNRWQHPSRERSISRSALIDQNSKVAAVAH